MDDEHPATEVRVAAMEQGHELGAEAIDQVLQIDFPGPLLARGAIYAGQLANPISAQIRNQWLTYIRTSIVLVLRARTVSSS